jgi:hypothetical protein
MHASTTVTVVVFLIHPTYWPNGLDVPVWPLVEPITYTAEAGMRTTMNHLLLASRSFLYPTQRRS